MVDNVLNNINLDDVHVYTVKLPDNVKEAVTPSFCGYTVYINQNLYVFQKVKVVRMIIK